MPIKPSFGTVVATTVNVPVVNVALPPDSEETPPPLEGTIFRVQLSHPKATVFKVNIHALQMFSRHTCIRWDFASFQLTLPLSVSSSISCVPCWVLALIVDASAHFDNCEQCACSRVLVYALSYVGCLLALSAHLWFPVFLINPVEELEARSALSCAIALRLIKMQLSDVPAAVHLLM